MSPLRRRSSPASRFPEISELADPLLEVHDLVTHFRTERGVVRAVDGVSFTLGRGRTLGVVGESGSGKTVLSRSVMGLLPGVQTERSGTVRFAGRELTTMPSTELREVWGTEVAMVFQDPMTALNPVVRVGRQVTEALRIRLGFDRRGAEETAVALLESVGIPSPAKRIRNYPHELSGGMRQRVMIAIALACGPKLLLADEPTTGLDVTVQAQILDLLAEQQRERSMAMVLVTHDLGVVANRTDDIIVMYAGKVVEQGPTAELFARTRMPYTEALLRSIPRLTDPSHTRLNAIPGRPPNLIDPPAGCRFAPRCPYAQDRCREEEPPLRTAGPDHLFACWFPVGSEEGRRALEDNLEKRVPAAVTFTRRTERAAVHAGVLDVQMADNQTDVEVTRAAHAERAAQVVERARLVQAADEAQAVHTARAAQAVQPAAAAQSARLARQHDLGELGPLAGPSLGAAPSPGALPSAGPAVTAGPPGPPPGSDTGPGGQSAADADPAGRDDGGR